ncbi:hypothetical protein [Jatrophihabitans sp.]|uniref:hypothetical protein n=1 Tax=Jatrophihabitans sp. TaxID=1932789 RepID=UPI0030C66550|nr:hypothetical protein [Jatrophihabitans sp.]
MLQIADYAWADDAFLRDGAVDMRGTADAETRLPGPANADYFGSSSIGFCNLSAVNPAVRDRID